MQLKLTSERTRTSLTEATSAAEKTVRLPFNQPQDVNSHTIDIPEAGEATASVSNVTCGQDAELMPDHVAVVTRQLRIHPGEAIRKSSDRPAPAYEGTARRIQGESRNGLTRRSIDLQRSVSASKLSASSAKLTAPLTAFPQRSIGAPRYGGPTARRNSSSRDAQKSET